MTKEEKKDIEELKMFSELLVRDSEEKNGLNYVSFYFNSDFLNSIDKAIKALEKQIPKNGYNGELDICVCPSCKRILEGYERFCWNCGQGIFFDRRKDNDD